MSGTLPTAELGNGHRPPGDLAGAGGSPPLTSGDLDWLALGDPPPPQLSLFRVMLLVSALCAVAAGVFFLVIQRSSTALGADPKTSSFAPYVDATLTPTYPFEDPSANPVNNVILGFIVAKPATSCTPSWGGYYTLAAAEAALNLDERISQVEAQGGSPIVSFGGRNNTELAVACKDAAALTAAYRAPVDRYRVGTIDLDLEGAALGDAAANERRGVAIAAMQRAEAAKGRHIGVWLTLPIEPNGFTADALATITSLLSAHVALNGVNVMAMDFVPSAATARDMIGPVESALGAAHDQLDSVYRTVGIGLASSAVWRHVGVTVMIGQNDIASERFTLDDARALTAFAGRNHLARMSTWSLNRDSQCGSVFPETGVLSNTCSGVRQPALGFTHVFSTFAGTVTASGTAGATQVVGQLPQAQPDNPATSPYPIWLASAAYIAGYKVVWHRNIYEAKWYNVGVAPDQPAQGAAQTPWLLIGPVLPGAHAPTRIRLDSAKHPAWNAATVYHSGSRVLYGGLPYEAKWYTQGVPPTAALPASSQSPWQPLYTVPGEPADPSAQQATP